MSHKKDIQLIKKLREDVRGSYGEVYQKNFGMVRHLVLNNSGNEEDASDVFQDTVIVLFEMVQKENFTLTSQLSTLIYSIARNQWFKKLKSSKENIQMTDFEKYLSFEEEQASEKEENEEKIVKMEHAVEAMGDPCKTILIHFYYLKKKMTEIAEKLNYTSADHAKTQKYKCLQRLKKMVIH